MAKLTDEEKRTIVSQVRGGGRVIELSRRYGISRERIYQMLKQPKYSDTPGGVPVPEKASRENMLQRLINVRERVVERLEKAAQRETDPRKLNDLTRSIETILESIQSMPIDPHYGLKPKEISFEEVAALTPAQRSLYLLSKYDLLKKQDEEQEIKQLEKVDQQIAKIETNDAPGEI